jgi:autoinducer 2-degrading protein
MFTLVVDLNVKPEMRERFPAAIEENAAASLRDEPGCLRFDVVEDNDDPNHFLLYEVHADESAFQAHRAAPHSPRWRAAAAVCLREGDGQTNTYGTTVLPARERLRARHPATRFISRSASKADTRSCARTVADWVSDSVARASSSAFSAAATQSRETIRSPMVGTVAREPVAFVRPS